MRSVTFIGVFAFLAIEVSSFTFVSSRTQSTYLKAGNDEEVLPTPTRDVVKKVAVAGATGRTGKLVVQELLDRDVQVLGMVRSLERAKETFPDDQPNLEIAQVDLTNEKAIESTLTGCDAVIWCATGFLAGWLPYGRHLLPQFQ